MPSRLSVPARWLAAIVLSALVACVGVEVAIRAFDLFAPQRQAAATAAGTSLEEGAAPDARAPADELADSGLQLHPFLGFTHRPGDFAGVRYNELGYTDRSGDPRRLAPDRFVIGIFGASVAMGVSKYGAPILREEIERHFPDLQGRVDVVNFATGGYKQPQQLLLLQQAILLAVPLDAVLNLDGFNEMAIGQADVAAGRHPLLPIRSRWPGLALLSSGAGGEAGLRWAGKALAARERAAAWRQSFEDLPTLRQSALLATLVGAQALRAEATAVAAEEAVAAGAEAESADLFFSLDDPCLRNGDGALCRDLIARIWQDASIQMDAASRRADILYLHFLQPNQYVEGGKPLSDEERRLAFRPELPWSVGARLGYPLLSERGEALRGQLAFHDLSRLFRDVHDTLYRDSCCHFKPEGYRLIGKAMAQELVASLSEKRRRQATS
jgi:hypothetical protein